MLKSKLDYLKKLSGKILKDEIFTLSAALALYTSFSLAPLVILLISFLSSLQLDLQLQLIAQVNNLMGPEAAKVLTAIIEKADARKDLSTVGGWIGSLTLIFSASVIFAHLQASLNKIFHTPVVHHIDRHWSAELRHFIMKRLVSFGIVLSFIFISIVSLMMSLLLSLFMGTREGLFGGLFDLGVSLLLFTALFSAIFKWMPDEAISGRAVVRAGFLTALLFMIGKTLIGLYLGQTAVGSAYGAAGSLIVLLLWVYYSSLIIFIGAEIASIRQHDNSIIIHSSKHLFRFPLRLAQRLPRWALWTLGALIVIRLILPPVCLFAINNALEKKMGLYTGHIRDFDVSLYRGAYQIQGLEIRKRNSDLPPLLTAEKIDLALAWSALLRKEITGNVSVNMLQLHFIHGSPEKTQLGVEEDKKHWQDALNVIIPISIENLRLENSAAYFIENKLKSPVPVRLENVTLTATDLRTRNKEIASPFYFEGQLQGHAPIKMGGKLDVLSRPPRGRIGFELEDFRMNTLNRLLMLYIPIDITKGQMSLYGQISTANSDAKGYFKIFLKDTDIIAKSQDFISGKHFTVEILSAFGNWLLKNSKTRNVAAYIPFDYTQAKLNINATEAFWSAIQNKWDQLKPGLEEPLIEKH